jgi:hypothetical protein
VIRARVEVKSGVIDRARRLLAGAAKHVHAHRARVGIQEDDGGDAKRGYNDQASGLPLAQVAAEHEFGTDILPERSFIRSWFDANEARLRREMHEVMRAEYEGHGDAVRALVARWAGELRDWIQLEQGGLEALSPLTVARKSAAGLEEPSVPLLATKQLVEAIQGFLDGAPAS